MKNNLFKRMICLLLSMVMVLSCAPVGHAHHHHAPDAVLAQPGSQLIQDTLKDKLGSLQGFDPNEEVTFLVELEGMTLLDSKPADKTMAEHLTDSAAQLTRLEREQAKVRGKIEAMDHVTVTNTYRVVLNGFAVRAKRSAEADLMAISGVKNVSVAEVYEYAEPVNGYVRAEHISGEKMDSHLVTAEGYTGKGTVTAILDTGLDVSHEAFQTDPAGASFTKEDVAALVAAGIGAEGDADSLYKSLKIPFAFDYADWDADVSDSVEHGTHVAGSIGANGAYLTGVAPDTQLVIMKVFSDTQNGAASNWIFAALEDAVLLGVDTINMSLGSGCGFSTDSVADQVYSKVQAAGINLMAAAGNDTDANYGTNLGVNLPLVSEPDNSVVGSPSTYTAALSVASVNEDRIFQTYLLAGDRHIVFSDSNEKENNFLKTLDGQTLEYVWVPGYGVAADFAGVDVQGKIALVPRGGEVAFTTKEENAYNAGAKAMIVYNNEDNAALITMQLNGKLPAVFISKEDGNYLRNELAEKKISISSEYMEYIVTDDCGYISEFSSLGVTPDLKLKPEIAAPGGYVYSTLPGGGYGLMSGTSMASPHMAGAASVLRQYVNETFPDMTAAEKQSYINTVLMNTAIPVLDEYGVAYTPRKQGAGLSNLYNAIHTGAYVTVDGSDRPKADLGDSTDGVYNVTLTVHNTTDAALTYEMAAVPLTAQQTTAVGNDGMTYDVISNYARVLPAEEFTVTFSADSVTVPANGTASVNVKLQLTDAGKAKLADFVCGTFLDGYIQLKSGDGIDLSVPYLGYYGDWAAPSVFDDDIYGSEVASVYPSALALFSIYDGTGFYLGTNVFADEESGLYDVFDADKVAYASRDAYYGRNNYMMLFSILGLLRSPEKLVYTITNAEGQTIYENTVEHEAKSYLTSSGFVNYAMGPDPYGGWDPIIEEEDGALWWAPDGDYTLTIDANVAGTDSWQTESFGFSIDNELPKVTETRYYVVDDVPYIDISMTDNNYLMAYQLISGDGTSALAAAEVVGEETRGAITTVTYDLSAVQEAGHRTARVVLYDYALNYAESDLFSVVSEFIEADTVTIVNQGMTASGTSSPFVIEAMIEPANAKDKTLTWTSSNPEVASVEALGTTRYDQYADVTYYQALLTPHNVTGDATITATATNGTSGSSTIHVTAVQTEPEEPGIHKVLHLDNGRKFYSKDFIIALLNELSAAGYTQLQLAVGNDGLRFVLDDMTITTDTKTYASEDVLAAIEVGNKAYHDEGEQNALTQSEMDEIIAHAESVGVEIVAHVNMTAHMNAALDAMVELGITDAHFTGYTTSDRSLNLNNEEAVAFTKELLKLYVNYFAGKGCGYFHIGSDEFGNDAYYGSMGFGRMGSDLYAKYAEVINACAQIVKDAGMTPRAWNDGISYRDYSSSFDTDMEITYWSSGWSGYNVASAATLASNGHGMINTHGDYYYVLGKDDKFTTGTTTTHDPDLYTACYDYELTKFMGSTVEEPIGGMFCVWSDYPDAETETEVAANIRLVLRAMAKRMDGESIEDLDTSIVEGGFNADGTINGPHEHAFGDWTTTTEPTCTEDGEETRTCECGETETQPVAALGHDYQGVVTEPTETEQGYTTYTCTRCGDSYVSDYTDPVDPNAPKAIPDDFTIREDGVYAIGEVNQEVFITDNAREVTLIGAKTKDDPYTALRFTSQITEGLHLTIENLHVSNTTNSTSSGRNAICFTGAGNVLTLNGTNSFTAPDGYYVGRAHIGVPKGCVLTINGEGTADFYMGVSTTGACIGGDAQNANAGTVIVDGGSLNFTLKGKGAGIGGASSRSIDSVTVNGGNLSFDIPYAETNSYTNNKEYSGAGIGTGSYVTNYNGSTAPSIAIKGGTITGTTATSAPIIGVTYGSNVGATIVITGGSLDLKSTHTASYYAGACIGTSYSVQGSAAITISGCQVVAEAAGYAAAIGSGYRSAAGSVTIKGGTVTATQTSTTQVVPAIGPGVNGTAGSVVISGGSVKATSASTDGITATGGVTNDEMAAVSVKVYAAPGVTSVTVDGVNFKISANHPDDENIYLWLTEGDHNVVITPEPAAHEHSFGDWTTTTEPTCTEEGQQTRTCACGETETQTIAALGHDYVAEVTPPTETEAGYTTYTCSRCGDSYVGDHTDPVDPNAPKAIPADFTIREDGIYEIGDVNQEVIITDNARNVTLIGAKSKDDPYTGLRFTSQITEGLHLTIENLHILNNASGSGSSTRNPIAFVGAGNTLTLKGENSFTAPDGVYVGRAHIAVPKGAELTIDGDGSVDFYMGIKTTGASIGGDAANANAGSVTVAGGTLSFTVKGKGAGIGGGSSRSIDRVTVTGGTLNITCAYGEYTDWSTTNNLADCGAGIGTGYYVTSYNGSSAPTIVIQGGTINGLTETAAPILGVTQNSDVGASITISGGKLNLQSTATTTDSGACIGSSRSAKVAPSITIRGGEIYAETNGMAAAIGSGANAAAGNVYIYGGTITAVSTTTAQAVPAIGPGYAGDEGSVWICGGSVKATSASTDGIVTASGIVNDDLDAVTLTKVHAPKVESVSVDGKDWKVSANHPGDEFLYLWLTAGSHEIVSVDDHEACFGEWTVALEPTCTEDGRMESACPTCGETKTQPIAATGHSYEAVVTAPTCTEQGYTTHTCANCGDSYVDSYTEATGHTFGDWTLTTAPTCTEDGEETRSCHCGETEKRVVEATGHDYTSVVTAPTCTEDGYTTHTCSVCGHSYVDSYIEATGHTFSDWTLTTAPTCTEDGEETRFCHCGETEKRVVKATGHSYESVVTEATCTEDGYTTHTCSVCGDSYVDSYTEATGHSFSDWVVTMEPTCTEDGEETRTCHCGETETRSVPAYCPSSVYDDVAKGSWYHDAVDFVTAEGLMNGMTVSTFAPNVNTSRAMMAMLLYRMAGTPDVTGLENPFKDVRAGQWHHDAIVWAYHAGVVNGQTKTLFNPDGDVQRQEMVVMLYRYEGSPDADQSVLNTFADGKTVYTYARDAFAWAISEGLVNGMENNTLQPKTTATRAHIATILMRYLQN